MTRALRRRRQGGGRRLAGSVAGVNDSAREEPRIQPLPEEEWDEFLRTVLPLSPGGIEHPLNIFTTLARHPSLFRRWMGFGGALLSGKLGARLRELVIMRTGHLCRSEYEWAQHVPLAKAAGISEDEIEALRTPLASGPWDGEDRLVLEAAEEIHEKGTITDPTWDSLSERFDEASLIELVMLVGQYHLVATTVRTLRIALEEP